MALKQSNLFTQALAGNRKQVIWANLSNFFTLSLLFINYKSNLWHIIKGPSMEIKITTFLTLTILSIAKAMNQTDCISETGEKKSVGLFSASLKVTLTSWMWQTSCSSSIKLTDREKSIYILLHVIFISHHEPLIYILKYKVRSEMSNYRYIHRLWKS